MTGPALEVRDVHKQFPGVKALDGVQMHVDRGEVHALLGENGAGKSTLLKILSAALAADQGECLLDGRALDPTDTPLARQRLGLATIYQEFNLLPFMSVAENLYIGREPTRRGWIDWTRMRAQAGAVLAELGLDVDPAQQVRWLSVARQQMVEIARAMTQSAKLIIMDEPTAALSSREVEVLHGVIRNLKARGVSVVYVTHRLREIKEICDSFTVLRDGRFVARGAVRDAEVADIVRLMVGRDVEFVKRARTGPGGSTVMSVKGICTERGPLGFHATALHDVSLEVRAGEVLGFAGLVGAGRTELARILFGADRCVRGVLYLSGRELRPFTAPADAIDAGLALVPEDRKQQGCFLEQSVCRNLTLPSLRRLAWGGFFVNERRERELVEHYAAALGIKMAGPHANIGTLSGGNQQKVLLARCMALNPKILIVDEPTRGIDVGAKAEVHQLLCGMAARGVAVIVISSELAEVMALSDRIVVFREGRVNGVVAAEDASEAVLMDLMAVADASMPQPAPAM
ncbi:MAG TPA: sugar ABC transporter ATP-binding protein [Steroidobacteraceae bacterium]|nr:sugar ABC transporter ATP-binding protein [Steroidobacteraceae bacterium]